jgi:hypothetical protein
MPAAADFFQPPFRGKNFLAGNTPLIISRLVVAGYHEFPLSW